MIALRGAIRHASKTKSSSSIASTPPYAPEEVEAFDPSAAKEGEWIWTGHWAFGSLPDPQHLEAVLEQARSRGRPAGGGGRGSGQVGRRKKPPSGVRPFVYKFQKIVFAKDVIVPSAASSDDDDDNDDNDDVDSVDGDGDGDGNDGDDGNSIHTATGTTSNVTGSKGLKSDKEKDRDVTMGEASAMVVTADGDNGNGVKGDDEAQNEGSGKMANDKQPSSVGVSIKEGANDDDDVEMKDASVNASNNEKEVGLNEEEDSEESASLEPVTKKPRLEGDEKQKNTSESKVNQQDGEKANNDKSNIPPSEKGTIDGKKEKSTKIGDEQKSQENKDGQPKTAMRVPKEDKTEEDDNDENAVRKDGGDDESSKKEANAGSKDDDAQSKEQESQKNTTTFAEVSEGGTFTDGGLTTQHRMRVPIGGSWKGYFENVSKRKDRMTSRVQETFHLFFNATPSADARMEFDLDDKNVSDSNDDAASETKAEEADRSTAKVLPPGYLHVRGAGKNLFGTFEIIGGYNVETGILSCQKIYVQTNDSVDDKRSSEKTKSSVSTPVRKSYYTRKRPAVSFRNKNYSGDGRGAAGEGGGGRRSSTSAKKRPRAMSESASASPSQPGVEVTTPGGGRKRSTSTSATSASAVAPGLEPAVTHPDASESIPLRIQTKYHPQDSSGGRRLPIGKGVTSTATSRNKPKTSPGSKGGSSSSNLTMPKAGNPLDARWRAAHFLYYHRQTEPSDGSSSSPSTNAPNPVTPTRTNFVVYEGEMIEGNNIRDGRGVCLFNNNRLYEGEWRRNKEHGQGTLLTADRSRTIYVGDWERGKMHGRGTYYYHTSSDDEQDNIGNGGKYIGEFKENSRHGSGAYTLPDGSEYEGEWRDDLPCGKGTFRWADGSMFIGHWKNGKRNGWGKLEVSDGFCYDGMWVNNAMEGKGSAIYPNGQKYDGNWLNGQRDGRGTVVFGNGAVYKGRFKEDCMEGQGTLKIDRNVSIPKAIKEMGNKPASEIEEKNTVDDNKKDADGDVPMKEEGVKDSNQEKVEDDWMIPIEFQSDIGHIHQKAGFTTGGE